jgi:thioredoxin reductase
MRLMKKSIVVLAGVIGLTTSVVAGNSGLSPIVIGRKMLVMHMAPESLRIAETHMRACAMC